MGTEFFNAHRQTDMTKLIMALRNFSNAPKNSFKYYINSHFSPHRKHRQPPLSKPKD